MLEEDVPSEEVREEDVCEEKVRDEDARVDDVRADDDIEECPLPKTDDRQSGSLLSEGGFKRSFLPCRSEATAVPSDFGEVEFGRRSSYF